MASSNDDFEIVESSAISFAKRGRKSNVSPALVSKLATLKPGQALSVKSMKVNMSDSNYKTEKSRVSAQIRTACRTANLATFDIRWTLDGTPTVCV